MPLVSDLVSALPSLEATLILPYLNNSPDCRKIPNAVLFKTALTLPSQWRTLPELGLMTRHISFIRVVQLECLNVLCMELRTLIQHIKEHRLHGDVTKGDAMFFYNLRVDDVELAGICISDKGKTYFI